MKADKQGQPKHPGKIIRKKNSDSNADQSRPSIRQKILFAAANLFAVKGFTETTMREVAQALGVKGPALYNHFPSKNAILDGIIKDYVHIIWDRRCNLSMHTYLREHPAVDGIMNCIRLSFPEEKKEYYLKIICVLLQEQHRNPAIRSYVSKTVFTDCASFILILFEALKGLNIIRQDTDPDFWIKATSSLLYTFASRMVLGIGDDLPEYRGKGLADSLRDLFELLLKTCGVENGKDAREAPAN